MARTRTKTLLNKQTLVGLNNPYDDDADRSVVDYQTTDETIIAFSSEDSEKTDGKEHTSKLIQYF